MAQFDYRLVATVNVAAHQCSDIAAKNAVVILNDCFVEVGDEVVFYWAESCHRGYKTGS